MRTAVSRIVRRSHLVMGTVASIHVHDDVHPNISSAAIGAAFDELDRAETVFSPFRADSAVCRIRRDELHPLDAGAEVVEVLDACTWLDHASGGAFRSNDPRTGLLDPSGYVKGWAAERASYHLRAAGLRSWFLGVGGDVQVCGRRHDGQPWRVAIADPGCVGRMRAAIDVCDAAVATSGTAARGPHLWDGRTGKATDPVASMTVVGPHLSWADAFATAAFPMGEAGVRWVQRFVGYCALAVTHDGRLVAGDGWVRP